MQLGQCQQCGAGLAILVGNGGGAQVACGSCHLPAPEHPYQKELDAASAKQREETAQRAQLAKPQITRTPYSDFDEVLRTLAQQERRLAALEAEVRELRGLLAGSKRRAG